MTIPASFFLRFRFLRCATSVLVLAGTLLAPKVRAAPPVITSPGTIDAYFNPEDRGGFMFQYVVTATNSPTHFGVAPLLPNMTFNPATGLLLGDPSLPGVFTLTMSATNADGTATAPLQIRVHPAVVSFRADTPGIFYTGDQIRYSVGFNAPVFVTGIPYVLANGRAVYTSGSGTTTLTFVHTVAPTDPPVDDVFPSGLELNGGTIRSAEGLDAGLILPLRFFRSGVQIGPNPTVLSESRSTPVGFSFIYQIQTSLAALSPTYTATPLPPGLLLNPSTGEISGTPPTAGLYNIALSATAFGGRPTASGTLALTITSTAPPPPPTEPPPPPMPAAQTITLGSVGPIQIGQPVTLAASATSGLPVVLTLVSGNATLVGSTLTVNDSGPVIVRGTQAGNSAYQPAVSEVTFSASRAFQDVDFASPVSAIVIGQPIQLSATATSGLPVSFTVVSGPATVAGDTLTVTGPGPVVVRATQAGNAAFNQATAEIGFTAIRAAQAITLPLATREVISDRPLTLAATASSGLPVALAVVSGPAILHGNVLVPTAASGQVQVRLAQSGSEAVAPTERIETLTILPAGRLVNVSARVQVREGDSSRSFIAGFVVSGSEPKRVLMRAIGPSLAAFGVQNALPNPRLRVFNQAGGVVAENEDWTGADTGAAFTRLGAFAVSAGSLDAALLVTLPPGPYTLHVLANQGEGVALAEIYDASDEPALESQQLVNLSTRAFVGTGEAVLASGFVVTGSVPKRVLVRGIGPTLGEFGVSGPLADPQLRVFQGNVVIAQNDDWQAPLPASAGQIVASGAEIIAASVATGAFALAPGSKDAALIITLVPGAYTAIVQGANGTTGAGMVEVYEIPGDR